VVGPDAAIEWIVSCSSSLARCALGPGESVIVFVTSTMIFPACLEIRPPLACPLFDLELEAAAACFFRPAVLSAASVWCFSRLDRCVACLFSGFALRGLGTRLRHFRRCAVAAWYCAAIRGSFCSASRVGVLAPGGRWRANASRVQKADDEGDVKEA